LENQDGDLEAGLKSTRRRTGIQWSCRSIGVMWSRRGAPVIISRPAAYTDCRRLITLSDKPCNIALQQSKRLDMNACTSDLAASTDNGLAIGRRCLSWYSCRRIVIYPQMKSHEEIFFHEG